MDLEKLYKSNNVEDLFSKNLVALENPEELSHCLDNSLSALLHKNMETAKKCVEGSIELDDDSIKQLVKESENRLCALFRLGKIIFKNLILIFPSIFYSYFNFFFHNYLIYFFKHLNLIFFF